MENLCAFVKYPNDAQSDRETYVLHVVLAHVDGSLMKWVTSATDPMHAIEKAQQSNLNEWETL